MHDDIDDLIRTTAPAPDAATLSGLEPAVWRRVEARHRRVIEGRTQAGALAIAILIGAAGGGVVAGAAQPAPSELRVLTVEAGLAPFSLGSDLG